MSTGNVTTFGYYIEARSPRGIRSIENQQFAREWKRLEFNSGADGRGVPRGLWCREAEAVTELMSYPSACALMAWAAASAEPFSGIEFRLVEAKFTCSWSVEEQRPGEPVNFFDRERQEFHNKRGESR